MTDPHGIPPVPSDVEPGIPRQRTDRPVHDPWDPAYVPDPRHPAAYPGDRLADGPRDEWRAEERYPDAFHVDDPYTRHGGDAYARDTAVDRPAGRRPRRRAAAQERPRRARRPQPERPPHADTLVRTPDELERDGGGLRFMTVAVPVAVGSLVAVGIGVWARTSDATGVAVNIAGFSSAGAVKTWLATLALVFALVQLWTAMVMRGRIGSGPGARTAMVHRWSGRIAVLVTVPVAVQCLIAMGWSGATPRTLVHSLLGCLFYGAFVTKMLLLRRRGVPGWVIAVSGGLLLAVLAGIWLTSALWFFGTKGLTF
ncbi:DUF6529 family protein [Pseudonocardia endophytica]|uniref:DUF6529 family protein n=1 Tax=Pseudonocardia endophytica TaxID=401976 RepID=UPI001FB2304E|nr:DUF6529 family protein [Pseudonocardia endophytica]